MVWWVRLLHMQQCIYLGNHPHITYNFKSQGLQESWQIPWNHLAPSLEWKARRDRNVQIALGNCQGRTTCSSPLGCSISRTFSSPRIVLHVWHGAGVAQVWKGLREAPTWCLGLERSKGASMLGQAVAFLIWHGGTRAGDKWPRGMLS